jgi:D-aminopeptidase
MSPGRINGITDVDGVRVGQATLIRRRGKLIPGKGPVRTGVTVVFPHGGDVFRDKVVGIIHTINGFGEVAGLVQTNEMGVIEGPILITNSLNVGLVTDAAITWALERSPEMGVSTWGMCPIVGECDDSWLNDIRGRHVKPRHVFEALDSAHGGPVDEGNVGAGTGMCTFDFAGGVGTSSRALASEHEGYTVGALVVSNFGWREQLTIDGVPVGHELMAMKWEAPKRVRRHSSIVMVLATDAPLSDRQLRRVAARAAVGLARTGSTLGSTSGDFVVAFSTTNRRPHETTEREYSVREISEASNSVLDWLFQAAAEAIEEAVLNAIFVGDAMDGRDGHVVPGLPVAEVLDIMHRYGRSV